MDRLVAHCAPWGLLYAARRAFDVALNGDRHLDSALPTRSSEPGTLTFFCSRVGPCVYGGPGAFADYFVAGLRVALASLVHALGFHPGGALCIPHVVR